MVTVFGKTSISFFGNNGKTSDEKNTVLLEEKEAVWFGQ
jgi:hypothetical protein